MTTEIGIIGGSGFYELLENPRQKGIKTLWGNPSDKIFIGLLGEKQVAFIPQHGKDHTIPPHSINYKANISALKTIGVKNIIGGAAVGIINSEINPGGFIIPHDFIDFTRKPYTFFDKFENEPKHTDIL